MDLFNREHLRALATTNSDPCVSLYMPAVRFEAEADQNPIRFKNLIKKAKQELNDQNFGYKQINGLFQPAERLLERSSYWHEQSDGLAGFLTPGAAEFFRLPVQFDELVTTGGRFHLKPLFPLIATNNRFYVLALSQNSVKLYQATHFSMSKVQTREIPESLEEALAFDVPERSVQQHTAARAGERGDSMFHGHGTPNSDDEHAAPKSDLHRFFRMIDDGLKETLHDENAPLLLAGVKYYLPIYRDVNTYDGLIKDRIIPGNPEHLGPSELHEKAWEALEPVFLASQDEAKETFHTLHGHNDGLTSDDLREIIPAATFGRVDTLFVPVGMHQWGAYDADQNEVELHETHQSGDEDLMDLAAVRTYLNGGRVHAMRTENMPLPSRIAASFRYKADVAAQTAAD